MRGMSRDVTTFVISMYRHIQTHQFFKSIVLIAEHVGKISSPVQQTIRLNMIALLVLTPIDISRNTRQAGNKVHRVVKHGFPIVFLTHPLGVLPGKLTFSLQRHYCYYKLCHWMRGYGKGLYSS